MQEWESSRRDRSRITKNDISLNDRSDDTNLGLLAQMNLNNRRDEIAEQERLLEQQALRLIEQENKKKQEEQLENDR